MTSKGCYVYLTTHRPSAIDRFPRSDTVEQNVRQKPRERDAQV